MNQMTHQDLDALFSRVPLKSLDFRGAARREEYVRVFVPRLLAGGGGLVAALLAVVLYAQLGQGGAKGPYLDNDQAAAYTHALGNYAPGFEDVKEATAEVDLSAILGE